MFWRYYVEKSAGMKKIFETNKESILLIPQIVKAVRRQFIYTCSVQMKKLIEYLQITIAEMGREVWNDITVDELFQILQAVVEAQESSDYILQADILEGDLLPFLQKLQLEIMAKENNEYPNYFEANLAALRLKDECLSDLIETNGEKTDCEYTIVPAINGQPTIRCLKDNREIYMHSMLDPENAAGEFVELYYDESQGKYFVWGIGLGYHITALLEKSEAISVIVLENNLQMIIRAMQFCDWSRWIAQGRIQIRYNKKIVELLKRVTSDALFLIHYPSLQLLPTGEEKEVLENYFVSTNSMREQKRDMDNNFYRLQNAGFPECEEIIKKINGKILVIVAAGPSLEKEICTLREIQDEVLILAVGTVAQNLVLNGIYPDFILITDAWEQMYKQIEDIDVPDIPLLLLSTASAEAAERYKGPCYIVYQEGYTLAEKTAKEKKYMLFQSGGSVTTLAIDMGIRLKARKIILVGADLAYTNLRYHAFDETREQNISSEMREVDGVDGKKVKTGKNLDIYRKWIENRIRDEKNIEIYNASHGARIKGTKEMSLRKAVWD